MPRSLRPLTQIFPLAILASLAACAPQSPPAPALPPAGAPDFQATIAQHEARDPESPEALNARLEYADFLVGAAGDDCHERLDAAQAQLDQVAAQRAARILLPLAEARLAAGTYKIHAARAECDPTSRPSELRQALDAATSAVGLYRDGLDYQSATVMQFNAAVAAHDLGDTGEAVTALEAAIAMDREYGFRDDAEDNSSLLLRWTNRDASDSNVAEMVKDFPARTADFKFNWSAGDSNVGIAAEDTDLSGDDVVRSRGAITMKRHVRPIHFDLYWSVTYDPGKPSFALGTWPTGHDDHRQLAAYWLARDLLETPKTEVGDDGDFGYVTNPELFGRTLTAQVTAQVVAQKMAQPGDQAANTAAGSSAPASASLTDLAIKPRFTPDNVWTDAEEAHDIETATWIGAKLEQGVWYQMTTSLSLPGLGLGHVLVPHDVEFAYTRPVACTSASPTKLDCAEIVVHATPVAKDLQAMLQKSAVAMRLPSARMLHFWSTTDMRLVVNPDTLAPYVDDTRRHLYFDIDGTGKSDPIIESERVVTATTYP